MFKWLKKLFKKKNKVSVFAKCIKCNEFVNNCKCFKDAEYKGKKPIYTLGSCDPRAFTCGYNSFSGTDVKIVFLEQDEKLYKIYEQPNKLPELVKNGKPNGSVQAFVLYGGNDEQTGRMTFILFDNIDEYYRLQGTQQRVYITAANEFGSLVVLFDGIVRFNNHIQWSVSIDDLVTEVHLGFEVVSQKIEGHNTVFETKHEMIEYLRRYNDIEE